MNRNNAAGLVGIVIKLLLAVKDLGIDKITEIIITEIINISYL